MLRLMYVCILRNWNENASIMIPANTNPIDTNAVMKGIPTLNGCMIMVMDNKSNTIPQKMVHLLPFNRKRFKSDPRLMMIKLRVMSHRPISMGNRVALIPIWLHNNIPNNMSIMPPMIFHERVANQLREVMAIVSSEMPDNKIPMPIMMLNIRKLSNG